VAPSIREVALPEVALEILLLPAAGGGVGVQQADDSDLLDLNLLRVVQFDLDVLEYESPHIVAETVCVEMSLRVCISIAIASTITWANVEKQAMRLVAKETIGVN